MRKSFSTIRNLILEFSGFSAWKWIYKMENSGVLDAIYENKFSEMEKFGWSVVTAETVAIGTVVERILGKDRFITVTHCSETDRITITFTSGGDYLKISAMGDKSHSDMTLEHREVSEP